MCCGALAENMKPFPVLRCLRTKRSSKYFFDQAVFAAIVCSSALLVYVRLLSQFPSVFSRGVDQNKYICLRNWQSACGETRWWILSGAVLTPSMIFWRNLIDTYKPQRPWRPHLSKFPLERIEFSPPVQNAAAFRRERPKWEPQPSAYQPLICHMFFDLIYRKNLHKRSAASRFAVTLVKACKLAPRIE